MAANLVRQYITQDLSLDEKKSYLEYINGNENSIYWIDKCLRRREPLLLLELTCDYHIGDSLCGKWVNISENGICKCSDGHESYDVVLQTIEKITSK